MIGHWTALVTLRRLHKASGMHHERVTDINDPLKTKGFIAIQSPNFEFVGLIGPLVKYLVFINTLGYLCWPDRPTGEISSVYQYLRISKVIRESGLPNYIQARIPLKSGLKIEACKRQICNSPDKKITQYLQYGFLLSQTTIHKPSAIRISKIIIQHCNTL